MALVLLLRNSRDGHRINGLLLSCKLELSILQLTLLLLNEHLDVVVRQIQLEFLANVVNEHADNVPVTQILYVFFKDVPFQAFEGKPYLLVEHLGLEMIVRSILFRNYGL